MVKKLLQGFLVLLLLLLVGLAGGLWYLNGWLDSNEEKLLHELTETAGLEVAFRRVDLRAWESFPRVSMSVDSLVVRDSLLPRDAPALLEVRRLRGEISLDALLERHPARTGRRTTRGEHPPGNLLHGAHQCRATVSGRFHVRRTCALRPGPGL